ncbi:MAG: FCD domain-containing protein, partial [Lachnospiraceae bacterium]|nr:FCD domain-containing protein [Lachnospiraceae bacterium]
YHMAIVKLTGNPLMVKAYEILQNVLEESMISVIEKMKYSPGLGFHGRILDAMRKKDAALAEQLMRDHIRQNYMYFDI